MLFKIIKIEYNKEERVLIITFEVISKEPKIKKCKLKIPSDFGGNPIGQNRGQSFVYLNNKTKYKDCIRIKAKSPKEIEVFLEENLKIILEGLKENIEEVVKKLKTAVLKGGAHSLNKSFMGVPKINSNLKKSLNSNIIHNSASFNIRDFNKMLSESISNNFRGM